VRIGESRMLRWLGFVSRLAGRYFALCVLAGAVCGWMAPGAFVWVKPNIALLLGVIMFGMGMTLEVEDFQLILVRPRDVMAGVVAQYSVMPLLAFGLAKALALPPELAVGVILVGACPGGTASNVVTFLARGDVALSVTMTSIATLLAPVLTPLLTLWLAQAWVPVSAAALFLSIIKMVIVPVGLGLLAHRYWRGLVHGLLPVLPLLSVAAIVLIVAYVFGANAQRMAASGMVTAIAVVIHNGCGLALGYGLARRLGMAEARRRAVCLEVGMQNSGLAVALAAAHFDPAAAVPGALFSVWHNISGPALATRWARRAKPESPR